MLAYQQPTIHQLFLKSGTMRWLSLLVLCIQTAAIAEQTNLYNTDDDDFDDGDDTNCLPKLADECFKDVHDNFQCHLSPQTLPTCVKKDVSDLCSAIKGGIDCASDIIDTDCTKSDGRDRFDAWMNGLSKLNENLCAHDMEMMKTLIGPSSCWNSLEFIKCLELDAEVLHIVDFLKIKPDLKTCYRLVVSLAVCSAKATSNEESCLKPQNVIKELLHSFFTQSGCGAACTSGATSNNIENAFFLLLLLISATFLWFQEI